MNFKNKRMTPILFQIIGLITAITFCLVGIFGGEINIKINFSSLMELIKNL